MSWAMNGGVLHPFEIPGVRFPTDTTPPNQGKVGSRMTLWWNPFKLPSTLRIHLLGDRGIIDFIPLRYGDPFYRGRERGRGRGRGRRDWLSERPFERETNGGAGRGFFHGNRRGTTREVHQTTSEMNRGIDRRRRLVYTSK